MPSTGWENNLGYSDKPILLEPDDISIRAAEDIMCDECDAYPGTMTIWIDIRNVGLETQLGNARYCEHCVDAVAQRFREALNVPARDAETLATE